MNRFLNTGGGLLLIHVKGKPIIVPIPKPKNFQNSLLESKKKISLQVNSNSTSACKTTPKCEQTFCTSN